MNVKAFTEPLTSTLPVNWEPIWEPVNRVVTLNPKSGDTEAVTLPLLISVDINASSVNAERGMFLKWVPTAYIKDDDSINKPPLTSAINKLPLISTLPVNWDAICVKK